MLDNGEVVLDGYEITLEGRAFVEQRRRDTRNFWVPYAITTAIALMSLIGTIASNWGTIRGWFDRSPTNAFSTTQSAADTTQAPNAVKDTSAGDQAASAPPEGKK